MKIKMKLHTILLIIVTICFALAGCGESKDFNESDNTTSTTTETKILTTTTAKEVPKINFYEANSKAKKRFVDIISDIAPHMTKSESESFWDTCVISLNDDSLKMIHMNTGNNVELHAEVITYMYKCLGDEFGFDSTIIGKEKNGSNDVVAWEYSAKNGILVLTITRK